MLDFETSRLPGKLEVLEAATKELGFKLGSDRQTGALLRTLAATKLGGRFLELGTGTGLGTVWILSGMDAAAILSTVDFEDEVVSVARRHLGDDPRVTFHLEDGSRFIEAQAERSFDFIFADTWPGKFKNLAETLALLKAGGLYIVDDLLPQPAWPPGHDKKILRFKEELEAENSLQVSWLDYSTGLAIAARGGP